MPRLRQDEEGRLLCVACHLCSAACPAACLTIEAGAAPWDEQARYPSRFELDALRCVQCGNCVLACPVDAITMGELPRLAAGSRAEMCLDREQLCAPGT